MAGAVLSGFWSCAFDVPAPALGPPAALLRAALRPLAARSSWAPPTLCAAPACTSCTLETLACMAQHAQQLCHATCTCRIHCTFCILRLVGFRRRAGEVHHIAIAVTSWGHIPAFIRALCAHDSQRNYISTDSVPCADHLIESLDANLVVLLNPIWQLLIIVRFLWRRTWLRLTGSCKSVLPLSQRE